MIASEMNHRPIRLKLLSLGLPLMITEPMDITLKATAKPCNWKKTLYSPVHLREQVKKDLDRDGTLGLLKKV